MSPPWMERLLGERDESGDSVGEKPIRARAEAKPTMLTALLRAGGFERRVRLMEPKQVAEIALHHPEWVKWLKCSCVVRGRLIRRIELPDGTTRDLGICHACIQIYEVDSFPKLVARLPDRDIYRLRDELLAAARIPYEEPIEALPPELEEPFPPPPPEAYLRREIMMDDDISPADDAGVQGMGFPSSAGGLQPLARARLDISAPIQTSELDTILTAGSAGALRTALIAKAPSIVKYLCAIQWLNHWLHKDLIKCTCTDEEGRFETTISYNCLGDKPDLYFKAVQCIGGTLHTLYDPGMHCHTHWNYVCGTEVILRTYDPAARVCTTGDIYLPPPGTLPWIAPFGVGGTRLDHIKQPSGFTDYNWIVDAPFGRTLGFRHGYSSTIPNEDIFYYRWLYKKEGTSQWREFADPVAATVVRHFVDEDLSNPLDPPTFPAYTLGPHSVNGMHLYEFKPHEPPALAGHNRYWPPDDWFHEIYTGILRSHLIPGGVTNAAGRYKIKLEIYDQAGSQVPHDGARFRFIVPTGLAGDGVTILTRDADASEIHNHGFVFYLHIDNRACSAYIDAPSIGSAAASDDCGFLRYDPGDNVRIGYHATHSDNHAYHSFWIRRAIRYVSFIYRRDITEAVVNSSVFSEIIPHSYLGDGHGNFVRASFPSADLLGECTEAAFAEILRVYAKATNGWDRLHRYDARFERAFALARNIHT